MAALTLLGEAYNNLGLIAKSLLGVFLAYYAATSYWEIYYSPLAAIPGPFLAKFSRSWLLGTTLKFARCFEAEKQHQKYGPIVRLAPNFLSIKDEAAVKTVYQPSWYKSIWYKGVQFNMHEDHAMTTLPSHEHTPMRKLTGMPYTPKNLASFEPELQDLGRYFINRIEKDGQNGEKPVDMLLYSRFFALDSMSHVTLNEPYNILKEKENHICTAWIDGLIICTAPRSLLPNWAVWLVERIPIKAWQDIIDCDRHFAQYARGLFAPVQAQLAKTKVEDLPRQTLVSILLSTPLATTGKPMPDKNIISELVGHIFAGADTTSTVISYTMWALAKQPELQDKIYAELKENFADRHATPSLTSFNTPYLAATVKEGLRVYAAACSHLERVCPEGGANVCGYDIPAGTIVATQLWSMHRLESAFPDGDAFRPERWFEATEQMNRLLNPFGYANRTCAGQNLAMINIKIMLWAVCRNFKIELHPSTTNDSMKMLETFLITPKAHKCLLMFKPREQ